MLHPSPGREWLPLEHVVTDKRVEIDAERAPRIEFDASPLGFGALLRKNGKVDMYFEGAWNQTDADDLGIVIGKPDGQTILEYAALFLVLLAFGETFRGTGVVILGDNLGSLSLALTLKGDKALGRISREVSWRRVRLG